MIIKIILYCVMIFLSIFALSGLNMERWFLKNRILEARILVILLGIALGYLVSSFVIDFLANSQIL